MRLGAVLAGGLSSRFGSDKALALYRGAPMIDHAAALLRDFADEVVIVGGERDGYPSIPDLPAPGLGPLGGVCGALAHARLHGFETVLTVPCDTPDLPPGALTALIASGAPSFLEALPVVGLWLARDVGGLASHLASGGRRSVQGWARACDATAVTVAETWTNVNRPEDLPSD
jgi:molybdopterin-guanine dinucleotide biosynthesis protein A